MKLLVVHSMAIHGTASLKAMMSLLGTNILPVPSLLLTGLTNIPGHRKIDIPLKELLFGSLEIARSNGEKLALYVGYLGNEKQVDVILQALDIYGDVIERLWIDPVSGDHNRLYVPEPIVKLWPKLLERADWAFPNFTELKVHGGFELGKNVKEKEALEQFHHRYPRLSFVVTSLDRGEEMGVYLWHEGKGREYRHERLTTYFGGTGDVFASHFLDHFLFKRKPPFESLSFAATQTLSCMKKTIEAGESFLVI